MLFNSILSFSGAAAVIAAFPFFSLPEWQSSRRSVESTSVEPQASQASATIAGVQGGFCGSVPAQASVTVKTEQQDEDHKHENTAAPSETLAPSIHWSWNTSALMNLQPIAARENSHMYYGKSDPTKEGYYAFLTYRFTLPSVNLDHSAHVDMKSSWESDEGLLLIATAKGCNGPSQEDRCYFQATRLDVDETNWIIVANGSPAHPETLMESAETEWGFWVPRNNTRNNSTGPAGNSFDFTATATNKESFETPRDHYGLKTAPFGPSFDKSLDDSLGYHELRPAAHSYLKRLITDGEALDIGQNFSEASCSGSAIKELRRRRVLLARGFWSNPWHGFVTGITTVYNTVADALGIQGDFNEPVSFDLPGPDMPRESSLWSDDSIALFKHEKTSESGDFQEHVNIHCVDCGVSGQAIFSGKAKITPLRGIYDGELALSTTMKVVLKIGVDAQVKYSQDVEKHLFTFGLPGLSYGVVTVGPYISVAAKVALDAAAKGKLLVGGEMGLTQAEAVLHIFEPSNSTAAGWTPYFKPVLDAEGEIMLAASAALPISIKVGLKVASFETAVGLMEQPAISAVARVAGATSYNSVRGFKTDFKDFDGCAGISTSLNWSNKLSLDILGMTSKVLHDTGFQPFVKGCINLRTNVESKAKKHAVLLGMQNSASEVPHRFVNESSPSTTPSTPDENTNQRNGSCTGLTHSRPQIFKEGHRFDLEPLLTAAGSSMVASCNDGNIYVTAAANETSSRCNFMWPTSRDAVIPFDGNLNVMHYYASAMSAVGVSRLRSSPAHKIPNDAVVTVLVPASAADGSFFYMAADSGQQVFYPVVCDFVGKTVPRMFLAKDLSAGIKMLEGGALAGSITGATVEKCFGLSLSPQF